MGAPRIQSSSAGRSTALARSYLAFAVLLAACAGCASTRQLVPLPDQKRTIDDPSKGRIYVLRPTSFGGAVSIAVHDGPRLIGHTGGGGFLCWEREAGETEISGHAENTSTIDLKVEGGRSYYIEQHVRYGVWRARNELELLDERRGKALLGDCKPPPVAAK
jgi:hypothetical protein